MKCQIQFSWKNKEPISSLISAEFAHSMVSVKQNIIFSKKHCHTDDSDDIVKKYDIINDMHHIC